jgi:DNA-directed RNA polymerase specialized sigma24 family protein
MEPGEWASEVLEAHRPRLRAVAYRMLGSHDEADDVLQEVWFRLSRADLGAVENMGGWLTTVVGRVCLDRLRSRRAAREVAAADPTARAATDTNTDTTGVMAASGAGRRPDAFSAPAPLKAPAPAKAPTPPSRGSTWSFTSPVARRATTARPST